MMDEYPVNFRNVSNEGKTYFQGEIQGEKRSKLSFLFDDSLFIQGNVANR